MGEPIASTEMFSCGVMGERNNEGCLLTEENAFIEPIHGKTTCIMHEFHPKKHGLLL